MYVNEAEISVQSGLINNLYSILSIFILCVYSGDNIIVFVAKQRVEGSN